MQAIGKFLTDLWAKYAHGRTALVVLSQLQLKMLALHPTVPWEARVLSIALAGLGMVMWFVGGPHKDVTPLAPGVATPPAAPAVPVMQDGAFTPPTIPPEVIPPEVVQP